MVDFIKSSNYINQLKIAYEKIYMQLLIAFVATGVLFNYAEQISLQYIVISILLGSFIALYDLFTYRVLMVHFRFKYWGLIESIRFFVMVAILVATINNFGPFYMMLLATSYVILKLIFKEQYLQSIDRLKRLYSSF